LQHGILNAYGQNVMVSSRIQNASILAVLGLALWLAGSPGARAEMLRTGGTGATLETLRRLGAAFTKATPGITIEVIEGLGSSGGIAAVAGGAIDFSFSGRALNDKDDQTLKASVIARTPFCIVSSHPDPGDIKRPDFAAFLVTASSTWRDGKPVRPVLRPKSDSDSLLLANSFPNMADAMEKLRQRPEIPVAATDQDNAIIAEKITGSATAMTLAQLRTEGRRLSPMSIDGVMPTLENLESGAYPFGKDIYLVVASRTTPALDRFLSFLRSPQAAKMLRDNGSLPVPQ
jgi:phosphate transport system substrate-binding protein